MHYRFFVLHFFAAESCVQDKDSDVFQSTAMVLHLDDSNNTASVALVRHMSLQFVLFFPMTAFGNLFFRRRLRASKTKAATTSFSSAVFKNLSVSVALSLSLQ